MPGRGQLPPAERFAFAERLRARMEQTGIGPTRLALRLGLGYSTVFRYRTVGHVPDHARRLAIAAALSTTEDYLLGRVDEP